MQDRRILVVEARTKALYGAQRSCLDLMAALPEHGWRPKLLAAIPGKVVDAYRERGLEAEVVPGLEALGVFGGGILRGSPMTKAKTVWSILRYGMALRRTIRAEGHEVVYCNDVRAFHYAWIGARLAKVPIVTYIRSVGKPAPLNDFVALKGDRTILIAKGVIDIFTPEAQRKAKDRFRVLYTGYRFSDLPLPTAEEQAAAKVSLVGNADRKVVACVGSLVPRKAQDLLIRAIAKLDEPLRSNVECLLVGGPGIGYENFVCELQDLARELGLEKQIHFLNYHPRPAEILRACDVFALPSYEEGLPRSVVEALDMGVHVVATSVAGVPEIIDDPRLGTLFPVGDEAACTAALRDALGKDSDPQVRELRRNHVRNRFPYHEYIRGFLRILSELRP
jgi:glycosyltransferase involved in cell wall biosynthesis